MSRSDRLISKDNKNEIKHLEKRLKDLQERVVVNHKRDTIKLHGVQKEQRRLIEETENARKTAHAYMDQTLASDPAAQYQ